LAQLLQKKERLPTESTRAEFLQAGLTQEEFQESLIFLGENEHRVEIPGYFREMF
jgi:hypothetical protein